MGWKKKILFPPYTHSRMEERLPGKPPLFMDAI